MSDRDRLMRLGATILLVGLKGDEDETDNLEEALDGSSVPDRLPKRCFRPAESLVKLVREICS